MNKRPVKLMFILVLSVVYRSVCVFLTVSSAYSMSNVHTFSRATNDIIFSLLLWHRVLRWRQGDLLSYDATTRLLRVSQCLL